jgi:hypothetical protein
MGGSTISLVSRALGEKRALLRTATILIVSCFIEITTKDSFTVIA